MIRTGNRLGVTILLCAGMIGLGRCADAQERWFNLRTAHLNIITDARVDDAKDTALNLECFRAVYTRLFGVTTNESLRTTVVLFRDDTSYGVVRPAIGMEGLFLRHSLEPTMIGHLAGVRAPLDLLYHEYTHALTSDRVGYWPCWLTEGVAEVYSTFAVSSNTATVGRVSQQRLAWLRSHPTQFALSELLALDRVPDMPKAGLSFYAQSWLLTHYLMFESPESAHKFGQFCRLLDAGGDWGDAFHQAFQWDLEDLRKRLARYSGKWQMPAVDITFGTLAYTREVDVTPISEADANCYLAGLLVAMNLPERATRYFQKASAGTTEQGRLQAGLGLQALQLGRYPEARKYLRGALEAGADNSQVRYYAAEALLLEATDGGKRKEPLDLDVAKTIAAEAASAIKLRPRFAQPYDLLGRLCLAMQRDLPEGIKMSRRAVQLERYAAEFRLTLARLHASTGEFQQAADILKPLLASNPTSNVKDGALTLLQQINSAPKSPAP